MTLRPLTFARRNAPASPLELLLQEVRACQACAGRLPHAPQPVLQAGETARILVVGQAPGARVHASGIPWSDASGKRLRAWMGVDEAVFHDAAQVAIVPMGLCFPGRGASGDLPPLRQCAPLWHERLLALMPQIRLTLLVGGYAQQHFLKQQGHQSVTDTLRNWQALGPGMLPLPHPSPRNVAWFKANPWFEGEVVPVLRERVRATLHKGGGSGSQAAELGGSSRSYSRRTTA